MKEVVTYLFSAPQNGSLLPWLAIFFGACLLAGCAAWLMVARSGLRPRRRRYRKLRNNLFITAILGGLYVGARYGNVGFFNLRFFLLMILLAFAIRMLWWILSYRTLSGEIVDEKQALRKQAYFKRASGKRSSRRSRRRKR